MRRTPKIIVAFVLAVGLASAQTITAPQVGDTAKPAADTGKAASKPAPKPASLKLPSINGDTFDLLKLKTPLVVLVSGTDSASGAAAEAVQKAFAAAAQPAMYFVVIEAGLKQARSAAGRWKVGYVILSDSGWKMMDWLTANVPAKTLSPKARPPLVAFVDADGKVTAVDSKVTEAGVIKGAKAMSQSEGTMVDPVCGMTINKKTAAATYEYEGKTYYFCSGACRDSFAADPRKYLEE